MFVFFVYTFGNIQSPSANIGRINETTKKNEKKVLKVSSVGASLFVELEIKGDKGRVFEVKESVFLR